MNLEKTEIQGTLDRLAKVLETSQTTGENSQTTISRLNENPEKFDELSADRLGEKILRDVEIKDYQSVSNSQDDSDYNHLNSYLHELGNLLNYAEDAERQSSDPVNQALQSSHKLIERNIEKQEHELSQIRLASPDHLVKHDPSVQLTEAYRDSNLEKVETAGILDELLDRVAVKEETPSSVNYEDFLDRVELDKTDPKAVQELHQLLGRLTDPLIRENSGKSISAPLESDDRLDEDLDNPVSQPMTKLEQPLDESKSDKKSLFPMFSNSSDRQQSIDSPKQKTMRRRRFLGLSLVTIGLIVLPTGIYQYFKTTERNIEKQVTKALDTSPELAFYRIEADARGKILSLTGTLPSQHLRDRVQQIAALAAPNLFLDNKIIVVDGPADMVQVAAEVEGVVRILNQIDGINISAKLERGNVILEGTSVQEITIKNITQVFEEIPGVRQVSNQIKIQPVSVATRIYFYDDSAEIPENDLNIKISPIKELLQQYPNLKLKILGYTHQTEAFREILALERAQAVENLLEDMGIDRRRIEAVGSQGSPPDIASNQERWLSRCVVFEIIQSDLNSSLQ